MNLLEFIKSPWGVVCIGVLSSILGSVLYTLIRRLVNVINKRVKRNLFVKRLVAIGKAFEDGYLTALAQNKTSFHQTLLVSHYEIKITIAIAKTLGVALGGIALLVVFHEYLIARTIIVSITCILVAICSKRIKKLLKTYEMMFNHIFGDDYKEHMMEGIKHQWESLTGPKQKEEDKNEQNK